MSTSEVRTYKYFVDNEWRGSQDNAVFEVHEPYSGRIFARVAAGSRADARIAVDAAAKAFTKWSETPPAEKARLFLKAAEIVRRRRSEIAEGLARETGSTISFATFQMDLVAATLQQVAGWVFLPRGKCWKRICRAHIRSVCAAPWVSSPVSRHGMARTSCPGARSFHPWLRGTRWSSSRQSSRRYRRASWSPRSRKRLGFLQE